MKIDVSPGTYIVAVSGGVDSVALLHMLAQHSQSPKKIGGKRQTTRDNMRLIVAHFDHGIREDSKSDRQFVQTMAKRYKLPFVYDIGGLGPGTSEEAARKARYKFLHRVREESRADSIVTAHHQDDLLETAIINLMRGTGRKGLTSLKTTDTITRPLLHIPKQELINYAINNRLDWREDPSNRDTRYLRNHVRHNVLPGFGDKNRQKLLDIVHSLSDINKQIDLEIINHLHLQPSMHAIDRGWLIMLPHAVAREVLAGWFRKHGIRQFDKKTLERLVVAAKTYRHGQSADINREWTLSIKQRELALSPRDRYQSLSVYV